MATTLKDLDKTLVPRSVSEDVWKVALSEAVVPQLAKATPVILGDNVVPTVTKRPAASIVGEGANKPSSEFQLGAKSFRPIKAVVGVEFSMEAVESNPAGVLDTLAEELSGALSRQIDLAVIHGRQASDGKQLAGQEYLTQTTNSIEIAAPEDVDAALWDGYGLVTGAGHTFSGFAADPRLSALMASARDKEGRRLNQDISMGGGVGSYAGLPVAVSQTVSGRADASTDAGVYAIGGDFSAVRFGRALDIPLRKIEFGDPLGNGDLQRRNMVAFMAEALFGWAILDHGAFVQYVTPGSAEGNGE